MKNIKIKIKINSVNMTKANGSQGPIILQPAGSPSLPLTILSPMCNFPLSPVGQQQPSTIPSLHLTCKTKNTIQGDVDNDIPSESKHHARIYDIIYVNIEQVLYEEIEDMTTTTTTTTTSSG
jgi:hypothetical protein